MALVNRKRVRRFWTRLSNPPLFAATSRLPTTRNAARIHGFTRREILRRRTRSGRLGLRLESALWYALAPVRVLTNTAWNGPAIRRRTGTSLARQASDQLIMACLGSIPPKAYYRYRLYEPQAKAQAGDYLHRFETKNSLYRFLRSESAVRRGLLSDKLVFAQDCGRLGIRTVPILMEAREGQMIPVETDALPARDLLIKPRRGRGGRNIEGWRHRDDDRYESSEGIVLDRDGLVRELCLKSQSQPYLVQPHLVNHPDLADLCRGVLMTVRMVTVTNEVGDGELTNASFRLGGAHPVVDNMHRGGIAAAVELQSGRLGRAIGLAATADWLVKHPDTGAAIAGRVLPGWPEAVALACHAHESFSECVIIGWDVALLEDGPCIIEGNRSACVNLIQRPLDGPIGSGRFGELVAHQISLLEKRGA